MISLSELRRSYGASVQYNLTQTLDGGSTGLTAELKVESLYEELTGIRISLEAGQLDKTLFGVNMSDERYCLPSYTNWKYTKDGIAKVAAIADQLLQYAKKCGIEFEAVAVTGSSGIFLAPSLIEMGYEIIMIRRDGEGSHGKEIEGLRNYKSAVMIDDLICSGTTAMRVREKLQKTGTSLEAILLYMDSGSLNDNWRGIRLFGKSALSPKYKALVESL